ncbi:MAG: aminotransferase class V-fold PLP-dependent enzyme, partial [Patescibacteria group bacterium]
KKRGSLMSFTLEEIHPHDIAAVLDQEGIAVRAGHLCAMPLVTQVLGVQGVCRASFAAYTTTADVDALCTALQKVQKVFA